MGENLPNRQGLHEPSPADFSENLFFDEEMAMTPPAGAPLQLLAPETFPESFGQLVPQNAGNTHQQLEPQHMAQQWPYSNELELPGDSSRPLGPPFGGQFFC